MRPAERVGPRGRPGVAGGGALPEPPAQAAQASRELAARIADAIGRAGGWIGFDRYMALALYEPRLGYYAAGSRKFGAEGDFVTAPELSPLFGQCVAAQCAHWFGSAPPRIVEFGAGSGALAAELLASLDAIGEAPERYEIVEVSASLRERQRELLARRVPALLGRVSWLDALAPRIEGVVVANEVLDAMPVRLFRWSDGVVHERGVACTPAGGFAFADRPADDAFAERVRRSVGPAWGEGVAPRGDYVSEIGEQAAGWVATLAERLARGAMLLFDYGFPRAEFYHPHRSTGTLQCHYRHRVHGDPFLWPGLQDITAHVDFTAMAKAAESAGAEVVGYTTQAHFLISCGLAVLVSEGDPGMTLSRLKATSAVLRLINPQEMGEIFKVLGVARGVSPPFLGFQSARPLALEPDPSD